MKRQCLNGNKIKKVSGCVLLAAACLLTGAARIFPGFAQWYSRNIYPIWVNLVGRITGIFPFSLVEFLMYIVVAGVIVSGIRVCVRRRTKQDTSKQACRGDGAGISWIWNIFLLVTALFFLYVVNCGINYHRESFAESSGILSEEYSVEELKAVCEWLTDEVNAWSGEVRRDESGVMEVEDSVRKSAVEAMQRLGEKYSELSGYYPKPKPVTFSWILSIQNLTGVYSPFTIEANYNNAMADYNIPFTACHELSHLRGFMQEEEANFIAFLACQESEEASFAYSGSLNGWIYCMNVLYEMDYESWEEVRDKLDSDAEADLAANSEFWGAYDGTVAEVSNKVNDTYLKANGQAEGVKSYDRMVDLIVTYYAIEK